MKKSFSIKTTLKNEQGVALLMVLLLMTLFTIMGMSLLTLSVNNVKMSTHEQEYESAYYIAEAGANVALEKVSQIAIQVKKETEKTEDNEKDREEFFAALEAQLFGSGVTYPSPVFEQIHGETPVASAAVTKTDVPGTYMVTSVGNIGTESRTIQQQFEVSWEPARKFTDFSVMADTITVGQGGDVSGNIGVRSIDTPSVRLRQGSPSISGDIYVPKGTETTAVSGWRGTNQKVIPYEGQVSFRIPPFPSIPSYDLQEDIYLPSQTGSHTLTLRKNIYIKNISIKNVDFTIHTGNEDREIVIDNLQVSGGKINITGSGKVKIYVKNNLTFTQSSQVNYNQNTFADVQKITFYLAPSDSAPKTLVLGAGTKINGSIHAGNANIDYGAGSSFEGHVVTAGTNVSLSAGTNIYNALFYAPNAYVQVSGSADMRGLIVGKTFDIKGGWLHGQAIDYTTVPFPVPVMGTLIPYEGKSLVMKKTLREIAS